MPGRGGMAWVGGVCLALIVACGSSSSQSPDGGGGGGPAAPIALQDLCPVFTEDLCIYLMQCAAVPYCDMQQGVPVHDCYGLPQLTKAAAAGAVLYDASKVGACDARFRSDPCHFAFFLFTPDIFQVLSYCPGTITPQLKQ